MANRKEIVDDILSAMRRSKSREARTSVERWLMEADLELAKTHSWELLRRTIALDFSAAGDDGLLLPANLLGIDRVRDDTNKFDFYPRDRADVDPDESGYRYYTYANSSVAAQFGEDVFVEHEGTTFAADSLGSEDYIGDYIKFGSEPGYYELTAATTFTPQYMGSNISNGDYRIRPRETKRLVLIDSEENILKDRTVNAYYWEAPQPMYRDSDEPVYPISRPLELMVLIKAIGTMGKRQIAADRYRGELYGTQARPKGALQEAIELNADFPRAPRPRDVHNRTLSLRADMFGRRNRASATLPPWER